MTLTLVWSQAFEREGQKISKSVDQLTIRWNPRDPDFPTCLLVRTSDHCCIGNQGFDASISLNGITLLGFSTWNSTCDQQHLMHHGCHWVSLGFKLSHDEGSSSRRWVRWSRQSLHRWGREASSWPPRSFGSGMSIALYPLLAVFCESGSWHAYL